MWPKSWPKSKKSWPREKSQRLPKTGLYVLGKLNFSHKIRTRFLFLMKTIVFKTFSELCVNVPKYSRGQGRVLRKRTDFRYSSGLESWKYVHTFPRNLNGSEVQYRTMQMDDYVLRSDFEGLKEAVKIDKRNLDVSWIILCSESHHEVPRMFFHDFGSRDRTVAHTINCLRVLIEFLSPGSYPHLFHAVWICDGTLHSSPLPSS